MSNMEGSDVLAGAPLSDPWCALSARPLKGDAWLRAAERDVPKEADADAPRNGGLPVRKLCQVSAGGRCAPA